MQPSTAGILGAPLRSPSRDERARDAPPDGFSNIVRSRPEAVGRGTNGLYPEVVGGIENITPEMFDGTPWRDAFDRTGPDPSAFPTLVEKLKQLDLTPFDWPVEELAALSTTLRPSDSIGG